jgi:hypothetical protein
MTGSPFFESRASIRVLTLTAFLIGSCLGTPGAKPSNPASLRVLVSRESGTPISGASVCISTPGVPVRSAFTDVAGQVSFDGVEVGQVSLTASCSGFTGQSRVSTLPPAGGTTRFILVAGTGGPVCNATPSPPSRTPPTLAISSFDWHVNRRTSFFFEVAFSFGAMRTPGGPVVPTEYRVGESENLGGAVWTPFRGGVAIYQMRYNGNSLTAYGQRTLYLQVRQSELTSPVVSKTINLQPLQTREYRFDSSSLDEMLSVARTNGFRLTSNTVSATRNKCPSAEIEGLAIGIPNGYLEDRAWEKIVEVRLSDNGSRRFTSGWSVKSIEIGDSIELARDVARTISGQSAGSGFRVVIHLSAGPKKNLSDVCLQNRFPLRAIVLQGPADDLALDQAKRWKNMFPPQ